MKYVSYLLIISLFWISCGGGDTSGDKKVSGSMVKNPKSAQKDTQKTAAITFDHKKHDFGSVEQGQKVEHFYTFRNTGESELIISNASASCGCTVPSKPQKPISPGQKDSIKVVFDSEGRSGQQHKTITLHTNTVPKQQKLELVGKVVTSKE